MEQYTAIAQYYDRLNGADYDAMTAFLCETMRRFGNGKEHLVLDLACGTGSIALRLAQRGYDVIGVDLSADMLAFAKENAEQAEQKILYLQQDMRQFELYGTVDAAFCCLDSLNYLTKTEDIAKCFATVHNYLNPNGLFVFDVHTPYCLAQYGQKEFVFEEDGVLLAWQNDYHARTKTCDFYLSFFREEKDGRYTRADEVQTERAYAHKTLCRLLAESGFSLLAYVGDTDFTEPTQTDLRQYYICRCVKN